MLQQSRVKFSPEQLARLHSALGNAPGWRSWTPLPQANADGFVRPSDLAAVASVDPRLLGMSVPAKRRKRPANGSNASGAATAPASRGQPRPYRPLSAFMGY